MIPASRIIVSKLFSIICRVFCCFWRSCFSFLAEDSSFSSSICWRCSFSADNEYDKEAIKVLYEGLGKIGYVANSSYTVLGDSKSAGRIYDKIGKKAKAKVVLVTDHGTICSISKKSLLDNQKKIKKAETEVEE